MHRGACGRMTAPRRRRGAPGSVGLRPPSPGAHPDPAVPPAPALGGVRMSTARSGSLTKQRSALRITKSRGHRNQSGTHLVRPSNCLNDPDHLKERKPVARELLLGDPARLSRARCTLGSLSAFMKHLKPSSSPSRGAPTRRAAPRATSTTSASIPFRRAADRGGAPGGDGVRGPEPGARGARGAD